MPQTNPNAPRTQLTPSPTPTCAPAAALPPAGLDIQGTPGWRLFPSPFGEAVFSCNTYLVDGTSFALIVDAGTDPARLAELARLARAGNPGRPVFLCLTHCHWDHAAGAQELLHRCGAPAFLVAHAAGVEPLRTGDVMATVAFLYYDRFPPTRVDIALFAEEPTLPLAGWRLDPATAHGLPGWQLRRDHEAIATFYPLPGHTPDGIAVGVGDLLFCGDIMFAARPGVAGLLGWDRDALCGSLASLRDVLAADTYSTLYGGHGTPLARADAVSVLAKLQKSAERLGDLAALDVDRADFLNDYAGALLHEAERLCNVLAAKLLKVSFHLEQLEEPGLAEALPATLDSESVEAAFADFRNFMAAPAAGRLRTQAALKAVGPVKKIERLFSSNPWPRRVDASLVRRINSLFQWYMDTLQGCPADHGAANHSLTELVDGVVRGIAEEQDRSRAYMATEDDSHEAFLVDLVAALGVNRNLFATCRITCQDLSGGTARASFDKTRLGDALLSIFEILAALKAETIATTISTSLPGPRLTIAASGDLMQRAFDSDQAAFFKLTTRGHGARIDFTDAGIAVDFL